MLKTVVRHKKSYTRQLQLYNKLRTAFLQSTHATRGIACCVNIQPPPCPRVEAEHGLAQSELSRYSYRSTRVHRQVGHFYFDAAISLWVLPGGLEL